MKNKYFSFVALAAAALATSCASDDLAEQKQEQNQNGTQTVTLTASVNEGQTRVGMKKESSAKASFYWHKDDKILVQTVNNGSYSGEEFSIKDGDAKKDGATSATFTGTVTGTVGTYAVYPYSESHNFTSATALTYNLPASYTDYAPATKIFGTESDYLSNPINMPMLGTIADGKISFKCLGGLAVIRIDKMPAASGTLTISADQQLSGNFSVDLSADEAQIATTTASDGNGTVTFNFNGTSTGNVGVFYLPLATGSYTNLTIKVTYGETTQTVKYGSLSVARKSVTAIPLYANGTNGALTKFSSISGNVYTINGQKFVDLGLPSGLLWATMNIGASAAKEAGGYFAWGETKSRTSNFNINNCAFYYGSAYTKYNSTDNLTTLEAEDDAAYVNWGSPCRMPTEEEFNELINTTNSTVASATENGVTGYKVTGKNAGYTSNSIFLPAAGFYEGNSLKGTGSNGSGAYYWSSTLYTNSGEHYLLDGNYLYLLFFNNSDVTSTTSHNRRWWGMPVRAVTEK